MLEKIFLSVPNLQFCKNNFCQENLRAKPLILEWNFYYRNLLIQEFCSSNKTSHLSVSTLSSSPLLNNVCYSYRSLISFYPSNILFRPKALVTQEQLLARISKNKNNYSHKKIGSHSSNSRPVQTTFVTATKTCQITLWPLHPPFIFVWYDTTSFFYIGRKFNYMSINQQHPQKEYFRGCTLFLVHSSADVAMHRRIISTLSLRTIIFGIQRYANPHKVTIG